MNNPLSKSRQLVHAHRSPVQTYARMAGALLLVSLVAGSLGEAYIPSTIIVSSDAVATAQNVISHSSLLRIGFAFYLVEAVCDIALTLVFYILLKPVSKNIAILAALFGVAGTTIFAGSELFYLIPSVILGGASYLSVFSPAQLDALALLSFKVFSYGSMMFTVFYGVSWVIRGYLIFQSGYLPKLLGGLMALGGLAFVARNFLLVLAPRYATGTLLLLMLPGTLLLTLWLLALGVNVRKWQERTTVDAGV